LFERKKLEIYNNPDSIRRKLKVQNVKRGIAYMIAFYMWPGALVNAHISASSGSTLLKFG
jgi:hypothetical protein